MITIFSQDLLYQINHTAVIRDSDVRNYNYIQSDRYGKKIRGFFILEISHLKFKSCS